jgi:hypothetical protein
LFAGSPARSVGVVGESSLLQLLVERYLPGATQATLRETSRRLAESADALAAEGESIRYLGTTFVPVEESCFSCFESTSDVAVRRTLEAAGVPYARILVTEAVRPGAAVIRARRQQ